MKVLMIAPQPFFQPRGTPFSVLHRLNALSRLGHQIDLLTYPLGEDLDIEGVRIVRTASIPLLRKIPIGPSYIKIPLDILLAIKAIRMLHSRKYELLHTHEEAGFFGTYLSKRYGIPHLYDMHSSLPQQLSNFEFPAPTFIVRLFERLERMTIRRADAVITICPELHNYVSDRFPEVHQVLIENVADPATVFRTKGGKRDIRNLYGIDGARIILYAGTFEPYQGLDLLIEAGHHVLTRQTDVVFLLVGGTPDQVEKYRQETKQLGVSEHFIFTGSVPPGAIEDFVNDANVLVSPRVAGTNTPLKIYSYLRSGKPIVATRHITHTQVLNDEVAVLTEIKADDLAKGILKVLSHPEFARRLTDNARQLAENRYSYKAYLDKTRGVYEYLEKKQ